MSVEAMAWAFRQKLPPKPKIVLLALADQTDETTGRVCYGRTDIKHIAGKCSVGERSVYRYIAALIRNGYMTRQSGASRGVESQFWLTLDRPIAKPGDWQWSAADPDSDDADDPEGSANLAGVESDENAAPADEIGTPPLPQDGRARLSRRPENINAQARATSFSRAAQDAELENSAIEKKAASENVKAFVIEGTRAWYAWMDHRRGKGQIPTMPTCAGVGQYAGKRGWYLPSLFPPSDADTTGPPKGVDAA